MVRRESSVALTEVSEVATTNVSPGREVACSRYSGPCPPSEPTLIEDASGR